MGWIHSVFAYFDHHWPRLLALQGWRSRWVDTSAGRLHVYEVAGTGVGPPFLLVHGLGSRAADFALLVRRLRSQTTRIVVPDMPGHGWSEGDAPDPEALERILLEAQDTLLPEPGYVLGNSMGGLIAVRIALAWPDRVRALLLASPAGAPFEEQELSRLRSLFGTDTHADALSFVDRLMGPGARFRHFLALGVRARLSRPAVRTILERIDNAHLLQPGQLADLRMPVWLCWGAADRILAPTGLDYYRTALPPGAVVETPEEFGHSPFAQHVGRFSRRLRAFLASIEAAREG